MLWRGRQHHCKYASNSRLMPRTHLGGWWVAEMLGGLCALVILRRVIAPILNLQRMAGQLQRACSSVGLSSGRMSCRFSSATQCGWPCVQARHQGAASGGVPSESESEGSHPGCPVPLGASGPWWCPSASAAPMLLLWGPAHVHGAALAEQDSSLPHACTCPAGAAADVVGVPTESETTPC